MSAVTLLFCACTHAPPPLCLKECSNFLIIALRGDDLQLLHESECALQSKLLVVAFGSAPGTPNWAGLLSRLYKAAQSDIER